MVINLINTIYTFPSIDWCFLCHVMKYDCQSISRRQQTDGEIRGILYVLWLKMKQKLFPPNLSSPCPQHDEKKCPYRLAISNLGHSVFAEGIYLLGRNKSCTVAY